MSPIRAAAFGCMLMLLACGVQPVELLPAARAASPNEFIEGEVPDEAVARLRAARSEQGPQLLQFLYPLPPELIVPADLAPIRFEWLSAAKGKPAAMPMGMMMMPPAMPMGMPADPPPTAAGAAAPMPDDMMMGAKADKKAEKDAKRVLAYELRAHSDAADVRLYAAAEHATFPIARWRSLLDQHRAATLTIELRGVTESGEFVHAMPLELRVRGAMPLGIFYNFSATSQGLTRAQLKDTHELIEVVPSPLEAANTKRCIGCHAISRAGRQLVATTLDPSTLLRWSWPNDAPWQATWPGTADPAHSLSYIQATFDPTASRIAATRAGQLLMFNADTGMQLEQSAPPLTAAVSAPDWSPNGRSIVVETGMPEADGGSLATFDVGLDGSLSALRPLIDATGDERLRSPSYSPIDGEWIVYERRMGPPGEGKDSKLFMVRARGGESIELKALQKGARPMDGASSPSFAQGDAPGHVYVLFSSRRPVGSLALKEGQRQLFAAELDLSLAQDGKDPSHAAFWLPFQQLTNSYLRTQWAPALSDCTKSLVELCDGVDDDCDQEIDEDCCTPAAAESCSDGRDNDCDQRVDEGCDCAFQDICGNAKDDDCDLQVDEKPCMPAPAMR
ncbi:MAG TPA: MopE-related protein [Polyangiales bacterium]|nr:MopE-related protein [Polyangiales bacterium]